MTSTNQSVNKTSAVLADVHLVVSSSSLSFLIISLQYIISKMSNSNEIKDLPDESWFQSFNPANYGMEPPQGKPGSPTRRI